MASRNIPYIALKNSNIIQLGYGVNQKRIWATTTSFTSHAGVEVAGNKNRTKAMLADGLFTRFKKPDFGFALHDGAFVLPLALLRVDCAADVLGHVHPLDRTRFVEQWRRACDHLLPEKEKAAEDDLIVEQEGFVFNRLQGAMLREAYQRTDSASSLNRMMHLDLKLTLADNDLRKPPAPCSFLMWGGVPPAPLTV